MISTFIIIVSNSNSSSSGGGGVITINSSPGAFTQARGRCRMVYVEERSSWSVLYPADRKDEKPRIDKTDKVKEREREIATPSAR